MTLSKDNGNNGRPPQTRTGRIVMWCIFGVAAVMAVIAIVLWIQSGVGFF